MVGKISKDLLSIITMISEFHLLGLLLIFSNSFKYVLLKRNLILIYMGKNLIKKNNNKLRINIYDLPTYYYIPTHIR